VNKRLAAVIISISLGIAGLCSLLSIISNIPYSFSILMISSLASAVISFAFAQRTLRSRYRDLHGTRSWVESIRNTIYPELTRDRNFSSRKLLQHLREEVVLSRQRILEQESIFDSLNEGIVVVDSNDRIVRINRSAELLFQVEKGKAKGRLYHEILRNAQLLELLSHVNEGKELSPFDVILSREEELVLNAYARTIPPFGKGSQRIILVLNDITEVRRLENVRKDFVSNVSHELRTPVTSIKGAAETLLSGALSDPVAAASFLGMVVRHSERLEALLRDLLTLSSLEHNGGEISANRRLQPILPLINAATELLKINAERRKITINVQCEETTLGNVHPGLFQEAVVNLIDNGIKYSDEGTKVLVRVERGELGEFILSVKDEGFGIPRDHLSRIFERFYRVDSGRSRERGGTGLGLAIVKHIINAHKGKIEVSSTVGVGSEFTITLPK
jgi:two-component system, OmpR family, phosphate regulon sensor histidine kinase PhoR